MQAHGVWKAIELEGTRKAVENKTDNMALVAVYQSVLEDILLTQEDKKTAKEGWEVVKTLCQGAEHAKNARIQPLKAEFESMTMKETDPLGDFFLKFNRLVTNIHTLGKSVTDSYVVKKLLRAVLVKSLQIASMIEQFGNIETMTVEETIESLKARDERLLGYQLLLTEEEWNKREKGEQKLLLTRKE